jgi:hypothetical protein
VSNLNESVGSNAITLHSQVSLTVEYPPSYTQDREVTLVSINVRVKNKFGGKPIKGIGATIETVQNVTHSGHYVDCGYNIMGF